MHKINQTQQLVSEINRLHLDFSNAYFEPGKIEKINLSSTIQHVPTKHIYQYRLNLHECVNDYLMTSNITIQYFYRVKTRESIDDKIHRYSSREDQYPVNNWLNDIFGPRIILNVKEIKTIMELLDGWQEQFNLNNWCLRKSDNYCGLHIAFKHINNFSFPWELQIWNDQDLQSNIKNHEKLKRGFV